MDPGVRKRAMDTDNCRERTTDRSKNVASPGLVAMLRWPLITTMAIVAFVWIVFSILPPESGWHFGTRFKVFFTIAAVAGGLFFVFLKTGPGPEVNSPRKALLSIGAVFMVTISGLVGLGFVLPQYETPTELVVNEVVSDQERGRVIYQDSVVGCYLCHSVGGAGATRGPDLSETGEMGNADRPGQSLEEYLRESILDPAAYVVPDYPDIMPATYRDRLTDEQVDDLIIFLTSLRP